ncbi:hypothetical protein HQ447_16085, partial [bacterium]|nr:hypothetical protein [bacterium]
LPPADLKITLAGRDGRLLLDGSATAPDFAPALLRANMPFRPADWAADPARLKQEPLDARLDLPRLDLSRFSSLVPSIEQLSGIVTGHGVVAGTVVNRCSLAASTWRPPGCVSKTIVFPRSRAFPPMSISRWTAS